MDAVADLTSRADPRASDACEVFDAAYAAYVPAMQALARFEHADQMMARQSN